MDIQKLLDKRANLVSQARAILEEAEKAKRALSDEERGRWDALMAEVGTLSADIDRLQRQAAMEQHLAEPMGNATRPTPGGGSRTLPQFVSRGMRGIQENDPDLFDDPTWRHLLPFTGEGYHRAWRTALRRMSEPGRTMAGEMRALQADVDISGGYLVMPLQFVDGLIQAVDDLVFIRQWATTYAVPNADSLGAVSLDTDPADPTWTSELAIGSEDSSMALGKRELHPHPLGKYIKISRTLLRKVPNVEQLVRNRLGYRFGVTMENAYQNGTGVGQPLGVFTPSNDGIPTSRDVSTGNTATELRFDGLIEAKFTLKPQYWPRARWLFHRDAVKQIAKLKDGEGQYIWRESVRVGEPDRILGLPNFMSEYTPHTFTTGLYVGIVGDFSNYWIADSLTMELLRLVELYAGTNQVGLIGRLESDGMPVLGEAFVRVKLA